MAQTEVQNLRNLESFMGQPFSFYVGDISDQHFEKICQKNRDFRIEQTAAGELIIMPPTLPDTGWRNTKLTTRTENWSDFHKAESFLILQHFLLFRMEQGFRRTYLG